MSPAPCPFEYAVLRAVPRTDRGEFVNVGVVLYCQASDFLAAAVHLDRDRLLALAPDTDVEGLAAALAAVEEVCLGSPAAGLPGREPVRARFGWLTAPRSTVLQTGPVHVGMTTDPAAHLALLTDRLVR